MGFAAIARVTEDRWVAMKVFDRIDLGLFPGSELKIGTTICREIRVHQDTVAIDHIAEDEVYRRHPMAMTYGFQSYISTPIILSNGHFFGTLCAMDPEPAHVNNHETIGTFKLFAELIACHLDAGRELAETEQRLLEEKVAADLRERFIAILGHDLRNPLASIQAGVKRIARLSEDEQIRITLALMQKSVDRMATLVDNVMDFARGHLAGGINLVRNSDELLEPVLQQIVDEMRSSWPERQIEADFRFTQPVDVDAGRIAQMFSNLVGNALTHGAEDGVIRVGAETEGGEFVLWVANSGLPILQDKVADLFKPFSRDSASGKPGLGLGLYIASEIAHAHGGDLSINSTAEETRFTFRMPIGNHKG